MGMDRCLHLTHGLAKAGASNGVGVWCQDCTQWVTKALGFHGSWALPKDHRLLQGVDRETLPRVHASSVACEICEVETMTPELHHWCPRALYLDHTLPNEGPQAWLCQPCHRTWHAIVTPGLLPIRALDLVRSLFKRLRHRPGAWQEFVRVVNEANVKVERAQLPDREAA